MQSDSVFVLAGLIGFVAGLRSLTAPAAVTWGARQGWLTLDGSPFAFMDSTVALLGFSLLALAEFGADLHPSTPSRTRPGPLFARVTMGGLSGACLCAAANRSLLAGATLGGVGALIGTFAGFQGRTRLVRALGVRDRVVAVAEDLIAIVLAWCIVSWR
jgi:uncharacterized membrane protein